MTQAMVFEDVCWDEDARDALKNVASKGLPFDAYDLTEQTKLRNPPHPNMWGPIFRNAYKDGLIIPVGYRQSCRPGRSGGSCRVWKAAS